MLKNLTELYVSHNMIKEIPLLENIHLNTIDISDNQIEHLTGLSKLAELEELWASNNKLADFEEIARALEDKMNLTTVYFEGNPIQSDNRPEYRIKLKTMLPGIIQIDAAVLRLEK